MELNIVEKAREFAAEAHAEHTYNGKPYVEEHLDKVVENLRRHDVHDPIILTIAYLHDILEDTQNTCEDIKNVFGDFIATQVVRLTDGEGITREERQLYTYAYMRTHLPALVVKLADRFTNMSASFKTKYAFTYVNEYTRFKGSLMNPRYFQDGNHSFDLCESMGKLWRSLDRLNAEILEDIRDNPEVYLKLAQTNEEVGPF